MRLLRFALPLLVSPLAFAASFDCKLAQTPREKTICASPVLSKADEAVAAQYKTLRAKLSPEAAAEIQTDQRAWLAYLDKACSPRLKADRANTADCLLGEYNARKKDFDTTALPSGQLLFTRTAYVALPSKLDPNENSEMDPGVGIGTFRWPQIDRPSGHQIAFNQAVLAYAIKSSQTDRKKPATFLAATDPHGSIELSWTLTAANDKLLSIAFEQFVMGYGAAHPSTVDSTFHWNAAASRPLQPTDIFNEASGWRTKLIPLVRKRLQQDKDRADLFWTGPELTRGIREGLTNSQQWTLSSTGFSILFGQYQVAPYVAGMPTASFTWTELKPYLNPTFDPTQLPQTATTKDQ